MIANAHRFKILFEFDWNMNHNLTRVVCDDNLWYHIIEINQAEKGVMNIVNLETLYLGHFDVAENSTRLNITSY